MKTHESLNMVSMEKFLRHLREIKLRADSIVEHIAPFIVSMVQDNIRDTTGPPNAPLTKILKGEGKGPLKDTGELRNSITYKIQNNKLIVGTYLKHAKILHFGGIVTAENARKLAIPVSRKIKRYAEVRGVKGFLSMLKDQGWKIVFRDRSIIGIAPHGKGGFGPKLKNRADAELLFIRKKQVKIPKRPYMRLTNKQVREIKNIIKEELCNI